MSKYLFSPNAAIHLYQNIHIYSPIHFWPTPFTKCTSGFYASTLGEKKHAAEKIVFVNTRRRKASEWVAWTEIN